MAYRDDRQALELQLAELERENEELRDQLQDARAKAIAARAEDRDRRHESAMRKCTVCGGALLPVAVFAGRNDRSPLPLRMSTLRFVNPTGGFTHSAPILAKACSSCGFIHHFIDMRDREGTDTKAAWPPPEMTPTKDEGNPSDEP
ncbi:MAG: hypothetical protein AAGF11_00910 [Myxococcota bacterium]